MPLRRRRRGSQPIQRRNYSEVRAACVSPPASFTAKQTDITNHYDNVTSSAVEITGAGILPEAYQGDGRVGRRWQAIRRQQGIRRVPRVPDICSSDIAVAVRNRMSGGREIPGRELRLTGRY